MSTDHLLRVVQYGSTVNLNLAACMPMLTRRGCADIAGHAEVPCQQLGPAHTCPGPAERYAAAQQQWQQQHTAGTGNGGAGPRH